MAQLRTVMRLVGFNVHIDNARALSCNHAVVLARSDRWYQCGCGYEFAHIHLYLHIFAQWVSNIALWSCHQNASAERAHSIYIYIYIYIYSDTRNSSWQRFVITAFSTLNTAFVYPWGVHVAARSR